MNQIAEITLALSCWSVAVTIYFYILPKMREHHGWHVMGLNVFGAFAGYLGFEAVADSAWIDAHYSFYLIGNAMFPLGASLVIYGYWHEGRARAKTTKEK